MTETLEKLWDEYFAGICATIDTAQEKALLKKIVETHHMTNEQLTKDQMNALEKHMETVYELQGNMVKKAFFKGCEFALSFAVDVGFLK